MSPAAIALSLLLTGLAGAAGGTFWGKHTERQAQQAKQDADTVVDLKAVLDANADLVKRSAEASRSIRQAIDRLSSINTKTTKGISDELQATADSRAGCVFPAGVMRELAAARDRAADAATNGIVHTVPAAAIGAAADR